MNTVADPGADGIGEAAGDRLGATGMIAFDQRNQGAQVIGDLLTQALTYEHLVVVRLIGAEHRIAPRAKSQGLAHNEHVVKRRVREAEQEALSGQGPKQMEPTIGQNR
jgi:hypothetical protein